MSVRRGDWKLLLTPSRDRVELYDLPRDPTELTNLAAGHSDVMDELAREVLGWHSTLPAGPVWVSWIRSTYKDFQRAGSEIVGKRVIEVWFHSS